MKFLSRTLLPRLLLTVTLPVLCGQGLYAQRPIHPQPAQDEPTAPETDPKKGLEWNLESIAVLATDTPVVRLQKQRRNNAARWAQEAFQAYESGRADLDYYFSKLHVVARAELPLATTFEKQLALLRWRLAIAQRAEAISLERLRGGAGDSTTYLERQVKRLSIEIELQQLRRNPANLEARVASQWYAARPLPVDANDDEHRQLVKELHNTALAKLKLHFKQYQAGEIKVGMLLESGKQLRYAREPLIESQEQYVEMVEQFRDFCQLLETMAKDRFDKKKGSESDWLEARFARLSAELELLNRPGELIIPSEMPQPAPVAPVNPVDNSELSLEDVITAQGGSFKRDGLPNAPIIEVSFIGNSETNATLKRLAEINTIRSLQCRSSGVTDEGLSHLKVQTNLEALVLNSPNITDAGMKELHDFPRLKDLSLGGTSLTDAGLREIGQLTQLEKLTLPGKNITDEGVKHLVNLASLRELQLNGSSVTNEGLKEIGKLKSLQDLGLLGAFITDAGLKELQGLNNLRALYLGGSAIGDAGLKDLKSLELRSLWLSRTLVTDAGLEELAQIKTLNELQLIRTKVTAEGLAKFREAAPRCKVTTKSFDE